MDVLDAIPTGLFNGLGVVGLAVIGLWMFATGRLYTRSQVTEMQTRHSEEMARLVAANTREIEDARHERSEWRTEARLLQQAVVELTDQNRAMLTALGPTLTDFFNSLRHLFQGRADGREDPQ